MTNEQITALRKIGRAILETVQESGPLGAPGGIMYAALMTQGCTLNQFEQIMSGMVRAEVLTKKDECYHVGPAAQKLAA